MKTNCKIFKSFCLALSISVFNLHFVSSLSFASGPNSSSTHSSISDSIDHDDANAIIPDSSQPSSSTFSTIADAEIAIPSKPYPSSSTFSTVSGAEEVINYSQPCSSNSTTIVNNFINNTNTTNTTSTTNIGNDDKHNSLSNAPRDSLEIENAEKNSTSLLRTAFSRRVFYS